LAFTEYQATIKLWLELGEKGLMDTYFNPASKEKFQQALLNKPK
jgi:hypothetical protein